MSALLAENVDSLSHPARRAQAEKYELKIPFHAHPGIVPGQKYYGTHEIGLKIVRLGGTCKTRPRQARPSHNCAKKVQDVHFGRDGLVPSAIAKVLQLPPYVIGAIISPSARFASMYGISGSRRELTITAKYVDNHACIDNPLVQSSPSRSSFMISAVVRRSL